MSPLMMDALNLMLLGMGTVFVFLTILVLGTLSMSRLVGHWQPNSDLNSQNKPQTKTHHAPLDEIAAVAAAITTYRAK